MVAGLAYGSRFVGRAHAFGPHMWVQVWNAERWVSYDAGLGKFDAGHLALAVGDGNPESVRGAMQASVRAREAQALGFKKIVLPASNVAGLERLLGVRVVGVRSVDEALDELF